MRIVMFVDVPNITHPQQTLLFFTAIGTRTTKWLNLTNHLRIHNSNYETVRMLLDSPKVNNLTTMNLFYLFLSYYNYRFVIPQVVLMVTNTHVAPDIGNHTKVNT